jgi:hypothetical protein
LDDSQRQAGRAAPSCHSTHTVEGLKAERRLFEIAVTGQSTARYFAGSVDYGDLCGGDGNRLVRIADGQVGRIASWYHTDQSVGVQLPTGTVRLHCSRIQPDSSGLAEIAHAG